MDPSSNQKKPLIPTSPTEIVSLPQNATYPSALTLIRNTTGIYIDNFFKILGLNIFLILFLILGLLIAALPSLAIYFLGLTSQIYLIIADVIISTIWILILFGYLTTIPVYYLSFIDQKPSFGQVFSQSFKKINSYLWLLTLQSLLIFSGSLLLIIPGLILALFCSFAPFILMVENLKGFKAIHASRFYLKGHIMGFLWRQIVLIAIYLAFCLIIYLLSQDDTTLMVGQVISFIVSLVFPFYYQIYVQQNYQSLHLLKLGQPITVSSAAKIIYPVLVIMPLILIFAVFALSLSQLPTLLQSLLPLIPPTLLK